MRLCRLPRTVGESVAERWRDGAGSFATLGYPVTKMLAHMLARAVDAADFHVPFALTTLSQAALTVIFDVPVRAAAATKQTLALLRMNSCGGTYSNSCLRLRPRQWRAQEAGCDEPKVHRRQRERQLQLLRDDPVVAGGRLVVDRPDRPGWSLLSL